ncbi:Apoptotic ATPase [Handroanthus impetiginosus]|uniref:Apoptotic ATPase n=1 Tax=Handroanthus impetiginosus TaxID=429701 RepID=A0A2G9HG22_9LAMI|nr:Apoptotic ATPase [Handroanthus impetiginosus]
MADAIVSVALGRLLHIIEETIGEEINLIKGVKKEVLSLYSELTSITNVLEDAEKRRYNCKEKSIQNWLNKLEDLSYDVDDVLDEWNFAILKRQIEGSEDSVAPRPNVCSFIPRSCFRFKKVAARRDIAVKIKELKKRLDMIVEQKEIQGREDDKEALVSKLIRESAGQDSGPDVDSQLAFNDDRVKNCFDSRIWICVSDVFDEVRIAKGIMGILEKKSPNVTELEALLNRVTDSTSGKRFLLVLDVVWNEDYSKWQPIKNSIMCGGSGSKILVTTRSERVAKVMRTIEIHRLGHRGRVGDCIEQRNMATGESGSRPFSLFVVELQRVICSNETLFGSSGSPGDLELRGQEYFDTLRMRSFFEDFKYHDGMLSCKMHDIVHDFAQFLTKSRVEAMEQGSCRALDPSLVSQIKVNRSLFCRIELPSEDLLDFVTCLRVLSLCGCQLEEIPAYVANLIHLRYLGLSQNPLTPQALQTICCELKEIPRELGNLIQLRELDLSWNEHIKELPDTICNLRELETLNLEHCESLSGLPQGIHRLINVRHLLSNVAEDLCQIPQGFGQLTALRTLNQFHAGIDSSKLGYLKKLDQISGSLDLRIHLHGPEDVKEAQKAELRNKKHIKHLQICFFNRIEGSDGEELVKNEAMEALQPHPDLRSLWICDNEGKLPCLEQLSVWEMNGLEFLNKEFLGISGDNDASLPPSSVAIGFPKLKELSFRQCYRWKKWEDITAEEATDSALSIMPCLKELQIEFCNELTALPQQLLRKASALEKLTILDSLHLSNSTCQELPSDLLDSVTCLKVLSLCRCGLKEIPGYIVSLIHLRYLDLNHNPLPLRALQTICKLYKLQTLYLRNSKGTWEFDSVEMPGFGNLDLEHCASLSRLPEEIHRLVNLRHLPNYCTPDLCQIPQGFRQLIALRTLTMFPAGKGSN